MHYQNTYAMDKKRTADHETRLAYRIRRLSTEEREQLLQRIGLGRTALFTRLNNPGKFTLDEASGITSFLEELDNMEYDIYQLMRPVEIMPQTTAAE